MFAAEEADNGPVHRVAIPGSPRATWPGLFEIAPGHEVMSVVLTDTEPRQIRLIPYYAWNNRGEGSMILWLPFR